MKKIVGIFLISIVSLLMVGCGGSQPTSTKNVQMPSWYLNETPPSSAYYYGVGLGNTKESAKAKALSSVAGLISSTVSASMEISSTDDTNLGYTQQSKSNVKSNTEKINFTGVTILENAYVDGQFYTNVKVDRNILFNAQKKLLDAEYNKALALWKQMQNRGTFEILKNSVKVKKSANKMLNEPTLAILKSINSQFDPVSYRKKIVEIKSNVENAKSQIVIYLNNKGSLALDYREIVQKYISSDGIAIVENIHEVSDKKNLLIVDISVKAKEKNVKTSDPRLKGATFVDVTVVLTTKNSANKIVAQNRVTVRNISKDGLNATKHKTKKFEREIKRNGILNILLKTVK